MNNTKLEKMIVDYDTLIAVQEQTVEGWKRRAEDALGNGIPLTRMAAESSQTMLLVLRNFRKDLLTLQDHAPNP